MLGFIAKWVLKSGWGKFAPIALEVWEQIQRLLRGEPARAGIVTLPDGNKYEIYVSVVKR